MVTHASQGPSYQRLDDDLDENLQDLPGDADGSDRPPLTVRAAVKRAPTASRASNARVTQVAAPTEDVREVRAIPEGEWERWLAQTRRCLLFPCGPRKTSWDITMLMLILYSCVTVPFRIGMGAEARGAVLGFEILVSFAFCTDLVLNFYTAYVDGDTFVVDRKLIVVNYLTTWFPIDLLSSMPLEAIELASEALMEEGEAADAPAPALRLLRALRLFRLFRLLRLLKLSSMVALLEERVDVNLQILQLVKMVLGLLYLMHILGCFWFYLAWHAPEGTPTWLSEYDGGSGLDADTPVRYLYSVYWALMTLTTVGYGDITPANDTERSYALMSLLVGALVFGYILSSVGDLMGNIDQNAVAVDNKLTDVKNLLRWHRVPRDLTTRITRFYEFYFSRTSPLDEDAILAGLPPSLRREMNRHLLARNVVSRVALLNLPGVADVDMHLEAYAALKPLVREPREAIREPSAPAECVWFLSRGVVEACGVGAAGLYYEVKRVGALVGESALTGRPGFEQFVARLRCELFVLGVEQFAALLARATAAGRDAVGAAVVRQLVQHGRARTVALSMGARQLRARARDLEAAVELDDGATGEARRLRRHAAATAIQERFVRRQLAAFVDDGVTTLDAVLPHVYGGAPKPRPPPGPTASSLTPRGAVSARGDAGKAGAAPIALPAPAPPTGGAPLRLPLSEVQSAVDVAVAASEARLTAAFSELLAKALREQRGAIVKEVSKEVSERVGAQVSRDVTAAVDARLRSPGTFDEAARLSPTMTA